MLYKQMNWAEAERPVTSMTEVQLSSTLQNK